MKELLAIGLGGFCGALARHGFNMALKRVADFPWHTFAANMTGCLLIGILAALILDQKLISGPLTLFLATGFLGSLTTFSTFSLETFEYLQHGKLGAAAANMFLNLCIGLAAVWLGMSLVRGTSGS